MIKKKEFNDKEIEPFLGETTSITIRGREYKMRRLNIQDIFRLGRILGVGAAGMGKEIGKMELSPEILAGLLLVSFPYAEQQCLEFIASLINVEVKDLKNPELFPVDSILDILQNILEHEDVKNFFTKLASLLKIPAVKEFLKKG